ncbi:protein JASON-like isoform X2 [Diospyros lotus]|uniref:protein JASON-like isoform X2 n=1 Tax=Diospyros lotus TaxID=55363 RepID=UPI002257FE4B|nr:protein JASON-like isoform X2 [Diospyros lotus]
MGCFLACFGSSKHRERRNRKKIHGSCKPLKSTVSGKQGTSEKSADLISDVPGDKLEEQLSFSTRKKVTFDTNVRAYEPVSVRESADLLPESDKDINKEKEECSGESDFSPSLSGGDSTSSSIGSSALSHRYKNWAGNDDEAEEFDYEDNDLGDGDGDDAEEEESPDYGEDDDDDDGRIVGKEEVWSESIPAMPVESSTEISPAREFTEEVKGHLTMSSLAEREVGTIGSKSNARDRSVYVHPVLNPVENLTQWKAVKSKGEPPLKHQKGNFTVEQEAPRLSFSSEQTLKQAPFSFKSKLDPFKNQNPEMAVDASLSNWLASSETTPTKQAIPLGLETITSERSTSQGSNSVMTLEDRPILGALTMEELKQFSASSSPRRSPSRSPDEMPIIGIVGTYWSHREPKDSHSLTSYRGIPNTTSKYREDKRVNWHSTPFETRLERALNRNAAEA